MGAVWHRVDHRAVDVAPTYLLVRRGDLGDGDRPDDPPVAVRELADLTLLCEAPGDAPLRHRRSVGGRAAAATVAASDDREAVAHGHGALVLRSVQRAHGDEAGRADADGDVGGRFGSRSDGLPPLDLGAARRRADCPPVARDRTGIVREAGPVGGHGGRAGLRVDVRSEAIGDGAGDWRGRVETGAAVDATTAAAAAGDDAKTREKEHANRMRMPNHVSSWFRYRLPGLCTGLRRPSLRRAPGPIPGLSWQPAVPWAGSARLCWPFVAVASPLRYRVRLRCRSTISLSLVPSRCVPCWKSLESWDSPPTTWRCMATPRPR